MKFSRDKKAKTTSALREDLLKKLTSVEVKPRVPLTVSSLKTLTSSELMQALSIIRNHSEISIPDRKRPECPVKDPRYQSMSTYDHKTRMAEYLEEKFGMKLRFPQSHVLSVYEWLANAFEQARNGKEREY